MTTTLQDICETVMAQTDGASDGDTIVRPSEVLPEVTLPGFSEVVDRFTGAFIYGATMAVIGAMGPDEFETGAREYVTAALAVGVRAGQALAVGDLDAYAEDIAALDDLDGSDDLASLLGLSDLSFLVDDSEDEDTDW